MTPTHYPKQLLICTILLAGLFLLACQSDQEAAKTLDKELCIAYDNSAKNSLADERIPNFEELLLNNLTNPLTYKYKLDSLSQRMSIQHLADVKIYTYNNPRRYGDPLCMMQYSEGGQVFSKKLENRGAIEKVYKFKDNGANYYLIVSVFASDSRTILRVMEQQGNAYVETLDLFPYEYLYETAYSYPMDNFDFDTERNIVSYDGYIYSEETGEVTVGERVEWRLTKEEGNRMNEVQ